VSSKIPLVLPLKGFATAKQRLAGLFTATERAALARAMASDVLERLAAQEVPMLVVSGDGEAQRLARSYGADVLAEDMAGQSAAVELGLRALQRAGRQAVATVALDLPGLDAREVRVLLEGDPAPGVVAVADRHGRGTNALRLKPPDAIPLRFGPDSLREHQREAAARACGFEILPLASLAVDLDEPEDVAAFLRRPVRGKTLFLLLELDAAERLRRRSSLAG